MLQGIVIKYDKIIAKMFVLVNVHLRIKLLLSLAFSICLPHRSRFSTPARGLATLTCITFCGGRQEELLGGRCSVKKMAEKKALSDRAKMEGVLLVAQLDLGQTCEQVPPGSKRQVQKRVSVLHVA